VRPLRGLGILALVLLATASGPAASASQQVYWQIAAPSEEPVWHTSPEELDTLSLPTFAEALRHPGVAYNASGEEYGAMLREMRERGVQEIVHNGTHYNLAIIASAPPGPAPPPPPPPPANEPGNPVGPTNSSDPSGDTGGRRPIDRATPSAGVLAVLLGTGAVALGLPRRKG
jgi:hypothetical protein